MSHLNLKITLPAAILLGGFLICTTASYGTMEFAKTTKKTCVYCHEKNVPGDKDAMNKNLTAAGKYEDVMMALALKVADAPQPPQWKSDSFFRRFLPQASAGQ